MPVDYTPSTYNLEVLTNGQWSIVAEFTDIRKLKNFAKKSKYKYYRISLKQIVEEIKLC